MSKPTLDYSAELRRLAQTRLLLAQISKKVK